MRFNTLHHIHKMFQNCWRKSVLNTQNPELPGRGGAPPGVPYQGSALYPLKTLSGPQTPRRLSSSLTQNPGSAPDGYLYVDVDGVVFMPLNGRKLQKALSINYIEKYRINI